MLREGLAGVVQCCVRGMQPEAACGRVGEQEGGCNWDREPTVTSSVSQFNSTSCWGGAFVSFLSCAAPLIPSPWFSIDHYQLVDAVPYGPLFPFIAVSCIFVLFVVLWKWNDTKIRILFDAGETFDQFLDQFRLKFACVFLQGADLWGQMGCVSFYRE